jgi:hypothetical protein
LRTESPPILFPDKHLLGWYAANREANDVARASASRALSVAEYEELMVSRSAELAERPTGRRSALMIIDQSLDGRAEWWIVVLK